MILTPVAIADPALCNREATIVEAVSPVIPPDLHEPLTALVTVTVDANGHVIKVHLNASTGIADVDRAAEGGTPVNVFAKDRGLSGHYEHFHLPRPHGSANRT
ncbi:MAG: hypothetical protein ABR949_11630 [Candidatus Aquilonibacter sp.]